MGGHSRMFSWGFFSLCRLGLYNIRPAGRKLSAQGFPLCREWNFVLKFNKDDFLEDFLFEFEHNTRSASETSLLNIKLFHSTAWRRRRKRYSSYLFMASVLDWGGGEWSASRPGRALPPGKGPPVPIVQEAGWAPEQVWTQRLEEKPFRLCRESNFDRHSSGP
jgi:hypothetical protein